MTSPRNTLGSPGLLRNCAGVFYGDAYSTKYSSRHYATTATSSISSGPESIAVAVHYLTWG